MRKPYLENERFWTLPDEALRYIMKDAYEAERANPTARKAGKWLDEVNDAATVLYHRRKKGEPALAEAAIVAI